MPGQPLPKTPFPPAPPPPLNPENCSAVDVAGGALNGVNGRYIRHGEKQKDGTYVYVLDKDHELYHFKGVWKAGVRGSQSEQYYAAPKDMEGSPHFSGRRAAAAPRCALLLRCLKPLPEYRSC